MTSKTTKTTKTTQTTKVTFGKFRRGDYYDEAFMDFYYNDEWVGYIEKLSLFGRVNEYQVFFDTPGIAEDRQFWVGFHRDHTARGALKAAKDFIREAAKNYQGEPVTEDLSGYCWPR